MLVTDDGEIIAGYGRVEAAKTLGWKRVPTLTLSHLSEADRRAYVPADNKLALNAGWECEILAIELQGLVDLHYDVELTGFSLAETDFILDDAAQADPDGSDGTDDYVPALATTPMIRRSDLWLLGRHKLVCGDARLAEDYHALLGEERADLAFTDPPYNLQIDGHVSGLGSVRHREFAFASGEMSKGQFTNFLTKSLLAIGSVIRDDVIAFVHGMAPHGRASRSRRGRVHRA